MLNALFLNMYSVVPKRNFPVIILNKKSVLQYSSGIAPMHNSAITKNLLLNKTAIPRMINVWLLNHIMYCALPNIMKVIAGVIPISKKIIPSHFLFSIFLTPRPRFELGSLPREGRILSRTILPRHKIEYLSFAFKILHPHLDTL